MEVFHFGGWTGGWLSSFYLFPKLGNYLNRKKNQLRTVYQIYYLIILINRCFKDKLREGVKKSEKKVNLPSVMRLNILFSFYLGGEQAPNENCFMFENIKLNMNHITHFMVLWENWIVW